MNDRPTPLELICIANETLVSDVLPGAKPEQIYPLRMIANALSIAARELESHDGNSTMEMYSLDALLGESKPPGDLRARNRALARDIRRGAFENSAARKAELRQHLVMTARAKLAAAYPKALSPSTHK